MIGALLQGGAMVLFLGLGAAFPRYPQPLLGKHTVINIVTGLLMFLVRVTLVAFVAARADFGLVDMTWLGHPALQLLVAFLALDLTRYCLHYAGHRVRFLWLFHRVHHSSTTMDSTSGLRMHFVDFLQLSAIPIVLFSVVMDVSSFAPWVMPTALGIGVFFDAFQHANLKIDIHSPFWKTWNLLLNNPHFHSWHHTHMGHIWDGNYGNTLTIWDRLFRTDVTRDEVPEALGISSEDELVEEIIPLQLMRTTLSVRQKAAAAEAAGR
ncbi:MAG: sterol desaturase family protein [Alphaproteobacteria bacterium]|nr:sterol desaturase family protein [Alphaproteobacteria bacterium]